VRSLLLLDELADDGDARGAKQLAQLGEVLRPLLGGDAERALARAPLARDRSALVARNCRSRSAGL